MESMPEVRVCRLCGIEKPLDEFYTTKESYGIRVRRECKQCMIDLERHRRTGVCRVKLEEELVKQKGLCMICGAVLGSSRYTKMAVDHCHKTLKFRGVLCTSCNGGLGFFKDSPIRLQSAIEYLNRHNQA